MATVYFDSNNTADGSRDGSIDHPWLDPSELPTESRMQSGTEYLFRCGTETNFTAALRSVDDPAAAIRVGSWGSGARPIITAYRMLDSSECLEVDVDNSGATATLTPQGGTNLWRVPKTFFGLFAGDSWGAATDVVNVAGGGKVIPSAAREWCGAVADTDGITGGYGVVYSVGNPVDTYGGLYVSSFDETDWASAMAYRTTFYTLRALGGFELDGLDLRYMFRAYLAATDTSASVIELGAHTLTNMRLMHVYRGLGINGSVDNAPDVHYSRVRVHDNYGENLGIGLFDTAGGDGTCMNDARIYRNVLNGFSRAMSWGGFYITGVYTTDGSRVLVNHNTACNGDAGNFWPDDGYAFYQERNSRNLEFLRNYAWNCKRNYIALWGHEDVVFAQNVAIAPSVQSPSESAFITINSNKAGYENHNVRVYGNVASGFLNFATCNDYVNSVHKILSNISLGSGVISGTGGTLTEAVYTNVYGAASTIIDGNNFYNHGHQLRDESIGNQDDAPYVTNKITSDPSAEIARLPVPTDPTVNYALQIRPGARIVSGVVDLRPGTRLVA